MVSLDRIQAAFSSVHHLFIRETSEHDISLISFLDQVLPHIEKQSWQKRLEFGGVFINGLPVYEDCVLPVPCKVEYYEPKFQLDKADEIYPPFSADWIVWEDQWLIVTCKPNRLPTMAVKEQRFFNLKSYLEKHLECDLHFPSRLDMSTQGLVIASKHPAMHGPIQQLFESRAISKKYLFFTTGKLEQSPTTITSPIGKTPIHPVLRAPNGINPKKALTEVKMISEGIVVDAQGTQIQGQFIEATPLTGRTHQIRVHASSIGCPVCGDKFYNGEIYDCLCLLSHKISFVHPFTEEKLDISVPERLCPTWALPALFNKARLV